MAEQSVFQNNTERQLRRVGTATAAAYLASFVLLALTVAFGLNSLHRVHAEYSRTSKQLDAEAKLIGDTQLAALRRTDNVQRIILATDELTRDDALAKVQSDSNRIASGRERIRPLLATQRERAIMARQDDLVASIDALHDSILPLAREGEFDAARELYADRLAPLSEDQNTTFDALRSLHAMAANHALVEADDTYLRAFYTTIGIMLAGLMIASVVGFSAYRWHDAIARRLHKNVGNLRHLALHDSLTGLLTRDALTDLMNSWLRDDKSFAMLYMDLDGFKHVNEAHGREVGDKLLMLAAARIRSNLRGVDTVARLGGDEFVAVIHGDDAVEKCEYAARHIVDAFGKVFSHDDVRAQLSISIGIALAPAHGRDQTQLFNAADRAMYHAKKLGPNQYQVFRPIAKLATRDGIAV